MTKATFETTYTASLLRAAGGEARRLYGDTFPADKNERLSIVVREPLGVVGAISPFNAPLVLLTKMVAFPLAVGNTIVAKPSEETPMVALELAKLFHRAGLPAGAFNVVCGFGASVGAPLVAHPRVAGITFTGSTTVGRQIASVASGRMARVHMELGGKNPVIVLDDADVEQTASQIALGAFMHGGQICMASSRVIAEKGVARSLAAALVRKCESMQLGDVRDPQTVYGPLINEAAVAKVAQHCDAAVAAGAECLTGGKVRAGLVFEPTVFYMPPKDAAVWTEETFGPVTSIVEVASLDEAIDVANASEYGLSAAVFSNDLQRAVSAARRIKCGSVHIGAHSFQSDTMAPIGGFGLSSLGRSGGKYSAEHFTELKWISFNGVAL